MACHIVWTNVPWATKYRVLRHSQFNRSQASELATLENDATCVYLDATGTENQSYWYWIEAIGAEDDVVTLYAVWTALVGLEDDPGATITGNDTDGYVVKPSDGTLCSVQVRSNLRSSSRVEVKIITGLPRGQT